MQEKPYFNQVIVDRQALFDNFKKIAKLALPKSKLMAVIKGDAYGHGLIAAAKIFEKAGADGLGVLDLGEALFLRENNIEMPIFILSGLNSQQIDLALENNFIIFLYSFKQAYEVGKAAQKKEKQAQVMLKFDTGMGRLGFSVDSLAQIAQLAKDFNFNVLGLASHLATFNDEGAKKQLSIFAALSKEAQKYKQLKTNNSILASSGILHHLNNDIDSCIWLRPGILLYGYEPGASLTLNLQPALSVKSSLIQIRALKKGQTVSYDRLFKAAKDMILAVVPMGYIQGMGRHKPNCGWVLINGQKAPHLGRVCMNLSMYDITDIPQAQEGDEVVVIGQQGQEQITADHLAKWSETISYEIIGQMGRLNNRLYIN